MRDDSPPPSIQDCYKRLEPALDALAQRISTAPLPANERAGLALMVATHFFGCVVGAMGDDPIMGARQVADTIVDIYRSAIPRPDLKAVDGCRTGQ